MGDLIRRKDAINRMIQETEESGKSVMHINTIKRLLQDIDTAYDLEAVLEEMKQTQKDEVNAEMCPSGFIHYLTAVDIVRRGGAEQ